MRTVIISFSDPSILTKRAGVKIKIRAALLDPIGTNVHEPTKPMTELSVLSGDLAEMNSYGVAVFTNLRIIIPLGYTTVQHSLMFSIVPDTQIQNDERTVLTHTVELSIPPVAPPREIVYFSILSETIDTDALKVAVSLEINLPAADFILRMDGTTEPAARNHQLRALSGCVSVVRQLVIVELETPGTVDRLLIRGNDASNGLMNTFCVASTYCLPRIQHANDKVTFGPQAPITLRPSPNSGGLPTDSTDSTDFIIFIAIIAIPVLLALVLGIALCVYRRKLRREEPNTTRHAPRPTDVLTNFVVGGSLSPINADMWRSPPNNHNSDSDDDGKSTNAQTMAEDKETEGDLSEVSTVHGGAKLNRLQGHHDKGGYDDEGGEGEEEEPDDTGGETQMDDEEGSETQTQTEDDLL
eukprot:PhF_6_TR30368/c0_g1_i1/m.44483